MAGQRRASGQPRYAHRRPQAAGQGAHPDPAGRQSALRQPRDLRVPGRGCRRYAVVSGGAGPLGRVATPGPGRRPAGCRVAGALRAHGPAGRDPVATVARGAACQSPGLPGGYRVAGRRAAANASEHRGPDPRLRPGVSGFPLS
ncbi:hypothetical protein G6F40_016745 [Rhizopus arrhizus]|nr:hypothetical protein G6F40_016745 [Rhizopus arrhizus]